MWFDYKLDFKIRVSIQVLKQTFPGIHHENWLLDANLRDHFGLCQNIWPRLFRKTRSPSIFPMYFVSSAELWFSRGINPSWKRDIIGGEYVLMTLNPKLFRVCQIWRFCKVIKFLRYLSHWIPNFQYSAVLLTVLQTFLKPAIFSMNQGFWVAQNNRSLLLANINTVT